MSKTGRPRRSRIDYTPGDIEVMSTEDLRKTYTTLRRIAVARLKYLNRVFPSNAYKDSWKDAMPKLREMKRNSTIRENLAEVSRFLRQGTTVTAYRTRLETIRASIAESTGVNLPIDEIDNFQKFQDDLIKRYGAKILDSDEVVTLFKLALDTNISVQNVISEYWFYKKNQKKLRDNAQKLVKANGEKYARKWTATSIRERLNIE